MPCHGRPARRATSESSNVISDTDLRRANRQQPGSMHLSRAFVPDRDNEQVAVHTHLYAFSRRPLSRARRSHRHLSPAAQAGAHTGPVPPGRAGVPGTPSSTSPAAACTASDTTRASKRRVNPSEVGRSTRRSALTVRSPDEIAKARLSLAEILLAEARRGLDVQRASFDGLRTRTGTVVAVTALTATFLGARVFDERDLAVWTTIPALVAFVAGLAFLVAALWPVDLEWASSTAPLASAYLAADTPFPPDLLARDLTEATAGMLVTNRACIKTRWNYFRFGIGLLGLQVASWLGALIYAQTG